MILFVHISLEYYNNSLDISKYVFYIPAKD